ncbi:exonuclease SbcCD subunit D [Bombilactobacillus thymidiniphilus]|uniref:Nuclease SbcCD subunit D n=1 Tax=Bombilactobacillus thymidiniphilus TaxID=2923363 RepID=A0ABY4PBZ5_9LACO|nr:exonuclease SbcCD subunit D [Bombilactobacillus thymidiniphilus]UQS83031.1 exonuclease SbcCD subunit D [Bombilactobacillus thymidiniphilus]
MRFLHTADWHIGRRLHGFDLREEQQFAFQQIEQIALQEKVDGIIVAGDLYDRSLPSEESVATLNQMLRQLNLQDKLPLYVISGNHDSATRLGTGQEWYTTTQFYLHTDLQQALTPIELTDTQIFLVPYFEPFAARQLFKDDSLHNLQSTMHLLITKMKQQFVPHKKHILVAHFFVSGSTKSDSETALTIGGLAPISADLLQDFDYVALGHLHNEAALHLPNARYSGSPVKFSLSEAEQQKGVWIVDTDPLQLTFKPLKMLHDVHQLIGDFETLLSESFYHNLNLQDFFGITLTDKQPIPNVLARLREIYPNIISLERSQNYLMPTKQITDAQIRQRDPLTLLTQVYQDATDSNLTEQQRKWAIKALKQAQNEVK